MREVRVTTVESGASARGGVPNRCGWSECEGWCAEPLWVEQVRGAVCRTVESGASVRGEGANRCRWGECER